MKKASGVSSVTKGPQMPQATGLIVLGMAGSGKTTVVQRLLADAEARGKKIFSVNLDPAVGGGHARDVTSNNKVDDESDEEDWTGLPYDPNIDIRDSVNYREVMKSHGLGPNGAIMTSLNLYSTRFNEVVAILERRKASVDYFVFDTPGQIEVFTWSASGSIITETIASLMPTILVYVIDTPRSKSPATFTSNMLYACSVMFRTKLPMILVFNKTDVESHEPMLEWIANVDAFQEALDEEDDSGDYMSSLTRSMGLVLNEFYDTLKGVGFSAATGQGVDEFYMAVHNAVEEYHQEYLREVEARQREITKQQQGTKSST